MRSMRSVGKVRLDDGKHNISSSSARRQPAPTPVHEVLRRFTLAGNASPGQYQAEIAAIRGMPHKAIEPLQEMSATAIELPELPLNPKDGPIYNLNLLRQKGFDFVYDAGSGIQDVAVK
jgi:hypothetical protein